MKTRNKIMAIFGGLIILTGILGFSNEAGSKLFAFAAVAAVVAAAIFFARSMAAPLKKLERAAAEMEKGTLDIRTGVRSRDEIGGLARSFEKLNGDLKAALQREKAEIQKEKDIAAAMAAVEKEKEKAKEFIRDNEQLTQFVRKLEDSVKQLQAREAAYQAEIRDLRAASGRPKPNDREPTGKKAEVDQIRMEMAARKADMVKLKRSVNAILEKAGQGRAFDGV